MRFSGRPAGAGVDYLFFGVYRRKNCDPGFHGTEYSKGRCEEYKMKKKRFGVIGIALAILFLLGAAPSVLAAGLPSVAIPVKVEVEGAAPSVPEEFVVQMEAEDPSYPMPEGSVDGIF